MLKDMRSTVDEPCAPEGRLGLLEPHAGLSGIFVHTPTESQLDGALHHCFSLGRLCRMSTLRLSDVWRARRDPTFRGILGRMDLLVPEGGAIALASHLARVPLPSDRARTDLLDPVLNVARERGRRVFFLGGSGAAPFDWARRARRRYRGLALAGAFAPGADFRDAVGGRRLADRLNDSGADVIIALPSTDRGIEFPFRHGRRLDASLYLDLRHGPRPAIERRQRQVRRPLGSPERRRVVLLSD